MKLRTARLKVPPDVRMLTIAHNHNMVSDEALVDLINQSGTVFPTLL